MGGKGQRSALLFAVMILFASAGSRADPQKITPIAITASGTYLSNVPANVADGNSATSWNAGGYPSQWILLDLGRPMSVSKVRIQFTPYPGGVQSGTIAFGATPTAMSAEYSWNTNVSSGQWLEFSGDVSTFHGGDVRYIKVTTSTGGSWVSISEIEVYRGVEYFGYFRDSDPGLGQTCNVPSPGTCDFAPNTVAHGANLVWITTKDSTDLINRLAEVQGLGAKAMVDIDDLMFSQTTVLSTANWAPFAAAIKSSGYQSVVAAFYLVDEPYTRTPTPPATPITSAQVAQLAGMVASDFPGVPKAVTLTESTLAANTMSSSLISMLDWVGFDAYDTWSGGYGYPGGMAALNGRLRTFLAPQQRMFAVTAAAALPGFPFSDNSLSTQEKMLDTNLNPWFEQTINDSRYIAVVAFLWQSFEDNGHLDIGAESLDYLAKRGDELSYGYFDDGASGTSLAIPSEWSASSSWTANNNFPFAAFDEDTTTAWNSGGNAPAWIQASFPGSTRLTSVQLTVGQYPSGYSVHSLYALPPGSTSWTLLQTWSGTTTDGQVLTWPSSGAAVTTPIDATAIKVATTQDSSWVSWRDIRIKR